MGDDGSSKSKRKRRSYRGFGLLFGLMALPFGLGLMLFWIAPNFLHEFPEYFLPAPCREILVTDIMANPPAKLRVIKDLYSRTQVLAVEDDGKDICFFQYSRFVSSANERTIALSFSQFLEGHGFTAHLFIINALDGSYL